MKKILSIILLILLIAQSILPVWASNDAVSEADAQDIPELANESAPPTEPQSEPQSRTHEEPKAEPQPNLSVGTRFTGTHYGPFSSPKKSSIITAQQFNTAKSDFTASDYLYDDFLIYQAISAELEQRNTAITVPLKISSSAADTEEEMLAMILRAFTLAVMHTGIPTQGDYLMLSYSQLEYGGELVAYENGFYYINAFYNPTYYTSLAEEEALATELEKVIASFGFTSETGSYARIKTIYDYICANVSYADSGSGNSIFSAYGALINGKAVCQGYATLLYRMLLMAGVDNRVITGTSGGENHAWNIIYLNGFYYNVDSTWDSGAEKYTYFLKCPANFSNHTPSEFYTTNEFQTSYPIAAVDFSPGESTVVASGTCGEDVDWVLDSDGILTISGTGTMDNYTSGEKTPWFDYRNYVLGVVVEKGVQHVGNRAFCGIFPHLQAVSCTARSIGQYAFYTNSDLQFVELKDGVEEIGKNAFSSCNNLMVISIPATLKSIGDRAFEGSNAIEAVLITDLKAWCNIEFGYHINYNVRQYMSNPLRNNATLYLNGAIMTNLVIPEDITSISDGAFYGANISSVIMHDNITEVGAYAFTYTTLEELRLSCSLNAIQPYTFTHLKIDTLIIPEGIKRIEDHAFSSSSYTFNAICFPSTLEYYGLNYLLADQIYISDLAAWCDVEIIGQGSPAREGADYFLNGQLLTDLVIPDGVREIRAYTFMGSSIQSLTLPSSVEVVGDYAFFDSSLKEAILSDNVQTVGDSAFAENSDLAKIYLGKNLTKVGREAFYGTAITELTLPSSINELGDGAFKACVRLSNLDLGYTLTSISASAFQSCLSLTELNIPDQITSMGASAFKGCGSLSSVKIGSGLRIIPHYAFAHCSALTSVNIGEGVEIIQYNAFDSCKNLKLIVMPSTLKQLHNSVFRMCFKLERIVFTGHPPTISSDALSGMENGGHITINYPCNDPTWTQDTFKGYSHPMAQWLPCHDCEDGICILCGAKEIVANGINGMFNTPWFLDVDGTMTVSGTDSMPNNPPYDSITSQVRKVIIKEGMVRLQPYSFTQSYPNLSTIVFMGNAPAIDSKAFSKLTATVYYPADNPTWTADKLQNYGGKITWKPACINGHTYVYRSNNDATFEADGTKIGTCSFCTITQTLADEGSRLISMTMSTLPNKTRYLINEPSVDITGATATVTCADGRTIPVKLTGQMVTGFETSKAAVIPLCVSYRGLTTSFDITVSKATVVFCYSNGTIISSAEYCYGETVDIPPEPDKPVDIDPEYIFRGWGKPVATSCTESANYIAVFGPKVLPGDFTNDDLVTNADVSYLLWHTLFPADYPLNNDADFTSDGAVTNADVSYLLWHTLFPADYPL